MAGGGPAQADDRFERLTNLLALLLGTGHPLTLEEITREIPGYPSDRIARRQAFERDKRVLRDEGVPVEVVDIAAGEAQGYIVDASEYHLPDLHLDDDERLALQLALAAVRLDGTAADPAAKLGLGGDPVETFATLPAPDVLPTLHEGRRRRASVTFTHRGARRTVDPWGLLFRGGFWYLAGRDHDRDALRTFRVDRIEGAVDLGPAATFEPPADVDLGALLADPVTLGAAEPLTARVAVDAAHVARVENDLGADAVERGADGSAVVTVQVGSREAFRSWLLGFMAHAEVLEPTELRDEVVEWLESVERAAAAGVER